MDHMDAVPAIPGKVPGSPVVVVSAASGEPVSGASSQGPVKRFEKVLGDV